MFWVEHLDQCTLSVDAWSIVTDRTTRECLVFLRLNANRQNWSKSYVRND